jgi:hypothetical protein
MSATTTVPITVSPEAAAFVAQSGFQEPLERMLEHTRQVIPALRAIQVVLERIVHEDNRPIVVIEATRDDPYREEERSEHQWHRWQLETFPPEVCQTFLLFTYQPPGHAG